MSKEEKTLSNLIKVANELQTLCEFEPPIKTKGQSQESLEKQLIEGAEALTADDQISDLAKKVLAGLDLPKKVRAAIGLDEEAEEEEEEEEEEVPAKKSKAKKAAKVEEEESEEEEEVEEEKPVKKSKAKKVVEEEEVEEDETEEEEEAPKKKKTEVAKKPVKKAAKVEEEEEEETEEEEEVEEEEEDDSQKSKNMKKGKGKAPAKAAKKPAPAKKEKKTSREKTKLGTTVGTSAGRIDEVLLANKGKWVTSEQIVKQGKVDASRINTHINFLVAQGRATIETKREGKSSTYKLTKAGA